MNTATTQAAKPNTSILSSKWEINVLGTQLLPSKDEVSLDNLLKKQNKKHLRRYRNREKIYHGSMAVPNNTKNSGQEIGFGLKDSRALLFKKKKITPSKN